MKPNPSDIDKHKALADLDPGDLVMEQYRVLRSKLLRLAEQRPLRTLVITSAIPGEGKTTTAMHLAAALAQAIGRKTVLIDCDLRRPRLHKLYGRAASPGLTDVLAGRAALADALQPLEADRLWLIPAGRPARNPSELIGSEAMAQTLARLSAQFGTVLLDAPPVLPLADPFVLGGVVDGFVFVIRAGRTPREVVAMALENLPRERVVGVVMNDVDIGRSFYHRYVYRQYAGYQAAVARAARPDGGAAAQRTAPERSRGA
jgi:capsular exopolysaccharide synthesis family protein